LGKRGEWDVETKIAVGSLVALCIVVLVVVIGYAVESPMVR